MCYRRTIKALALAALCAVPALAEGSIALPSGRVVTFLDTIWGEPGPAGLTVRFRFVDPDLAETVGHINFIDAEADMHFLCETYALARIATIGPKPSQIVISISDRPVAFGEADPEATQLFEAYRPEDGACIWEGY